MTNTFVFWSKPGQYLGWIHLVYPIDDLVGILKWEKKPGNWILYYFRKTRKSNDASAIGMSTNIIIWQTSSPEKNYHHKIVMIKNAAWNEKSNTVQYIFPTEVGSKWKPLGASIPQNLYLYKDIVFLYRYG